MFRSACAIVVWGAITAGTPADPPAPAAFEGRIKDVRGTSGTLTLALGDGRQARDRAFLIVEARVRGPGGSEWKVGDLRAGDRVRVELTADGGMVQVIRVLPAARRPGRGESANPTLPPGN
jgi:hypothetical protein